MAIIKQLSLATGGGIISHNSAQQASQKSDIATILIGLGGTGIDAIRTIKTQVYDRLIPDNASAIENGTDSFPQYKHIAFLGVDADNSMIRNSEDEDNEENLSGQLFLESNEFFSINNESVKINGGISEIRMREQEELHWISPNDVIKLDFDGRGAGGNRQVGRFLLMDKSQDFMDKLKTVIEEAIVGLSNNREINVHIFSGISGGTGAGTFLDVCYMVRHVLKDLRCGGNILGYFYMPDVNLANLPSNINKITRQFIPRNGYASMQELEYCMNFPQNGGKFKQKYKGGVPIDWDVPPVDLCHLISAPSNVEDPYRYAMQVTAEYVMDFFAKTNNATISFSQILNNFNISVATKNAAKTHGYNLRYLTIGASCATIPFKEINTYLASRIIMKYREKGNRKPDARDVDEILKEAWSEYHDRTADVIKCLYETLKSKIITGVDSQYKMYEQGNKPWKLIKRGEVSEQNMVTYYESQKSVNLGRMATNAEELKGDENKSSWKNKFMNNMKRILCDIDRGPEFVKDILSGSKSHNVFNVLSGLKDANKNDWDLENQQTVRLAAEYETNRTIFLNKMKKRKYKNYEASLIVLQKHEEWIEYYKYIDNVIGEVQKQLRGLAKNYYTRLADIFNNLQDTFSENYSILSNLNNNSTGFFRQLITIDDIHDNLEREVDAIDVRNDFKCLMEKMLENAEKWESDSKIANVVNTHFVDTFGEVESRTITYYLKEKYGECTNQELENKIYDDWLDKLSDDAKPLFIYDGVYPLNDIEEVKHISYPADSGPIGNAVQRLRGVTINNSSIADRIVFLNLNMVFPMAAYGKLAAYSEEYDKGYAPGRHYYEGNSLDNDKPCGFNDWRNLSLVIPFSLLAGTEITSDDRRRRIGEVDKLFNDAENVGLIDLLSDEIKRPSERFIEQVSVLQEKIQSMKEGEIEKNSVENYEQELQKLKTEFDQKKFLEPSDDMIFWAGNITNDQIKRQIMQDNFCYAPVLQIKVKEYIEKIEKIKNNLNKSEDDLKSCYEKNAHEVKDMRKVYFDAVVANVIKITTWEVSYVQDIFGIKQEKILSTRDPEYKYADIPVYQGFLSFSELDVKLRNEIRESTDNIFKNNSVDWKGHLQTLYTNVFSDNAVNAWCRDARENYPDREDEIVGFLSELKKRLEYYRGILL